MSSTTEPDDPSATPPAPVPASYGERFRRRFPFVLLVVAALGVVVQLVTPVDTTTYGRSLGWGVGVVLGTLVGVAFWTALVALVPGPAASQPARPRPWRSIAAVTGVALVLVVAALSTRGGPAGPAAGIAADPAVTALPVPAIADPTQGCQGFLDTVTSLGDAAVDSPLVIQTLAALRDSAAEHAPAVALDITTWLDDPTSEGVATMTSSILDRCVQDGYLDQQTVDDWATAAVAG